MVKSTASLPLGDNSGVGVLDKAVSVLAAVESGPATDRKSVV